VSLKKLGLFFFRKRKTCVLQKALPRYCCLATYADSLQNKKLIVRDYRTFELVQRYAHLDVKHLVQSASVIDGILNWNELNSSPQLVRKN
jgi:hypothetical protein